MNGLLQVLARKLWRLNTPLWFLPSGITYSNIELLNLGSIDVLDQLTLLWEAVLCTVECLAAFLTPDYCSFCQAYILGLSRASGYLVWQEGSLRHNFRVFWELNKGFCIHTLGYIFRPCFSVSYVWSWPRDGVLLLRVWPERMRRRQGWAWNACVLSSPSLRFPPSFVVRAVQPRRQLCTA